MPNCLNLPSVLNSGSYCLHGCKYHIVTWFNLVKPRDGDADVMGQCVFRKTLKKDPSWRELGRGGLGDCPWWMGGAVSMRQAGRPRAGPDGLAALRATVCAPQTVGGQTTITTQRVIGCWEGKKTEGANASPGDSYEKGRQTTSSRHLEKRRRRRRRPTPLPPHNPSPTRPINPTHTWCHPSGLNCPPTPPETHRGRSRKTPARPALPLSDAL